MNGNITDDSTILSKPDRSKEDTDLLNKLLTWLKEAEAAPGEITYRKESAEDNKFYAGDQDTNDVKVELENKKRPNTTYNIVLPKVNMLTGLAAQSHRNPYAFPVTTEDEALTEIMNGALKHYRKKLDLPDKEITCFDKAIKGGRSYLHLYISNENPFKPTIKAKVIDGDQCWPDPTATEYDMSDMRYFFADEWFDKDVIKSIWPSVTDDDFTVMSTTTTDTPSFYDNIRDLYRITVCSYYKYEPMCWYKSPRNERIDKMSPSDWKVYSKSFTDTGMPAPEMKTAITKRCYFAIFSGTKILEQGPYPYKHDMIPYIQFGAYKSDPDNRWFSVITPMKDPQRGLNTIRRQLVHLLQTLPKGILVHEVGAILNIEDFEERSSDPSFHLELGKDSMSRYKFEQQPQISPIYAQLDAMFTQSSKDVSGIQDSLMGQQTSSREPGVTVRMRQETGVAVLHILFNNLRKSRVRACKMLISMIQQFVTTTEIIRIEGNDGVQLMEINSQMNPTLDGFNDISYIEYDTDIDEVADNATMRSVILDVLTSFSQNNPNTIPPDLIMEYSDLPLSAKNRVRQYTADQQSREDKKFAVEQAIKLKNSTKKPGGDSNG